MCPTRAFNGSLRHLFRTTKLPRIPIRKSRWKWFNFEVLGYGQRLPFLGKPQNRMVRTCTMNALIQQKLMLICTNCSPARFFVSLNLKMIAINLLENYNLRLVNQRVRPTFSYHVLEMPHPFLSIEVRAREHGEEVKK